MQQQQQHHQNQQNDEAVASNDGGEAAKALTMHEFRLKMIVHSDGPEGLCRLWNKDVKEAR